MRGFKCTFGGSVIRYFLMLRVLLSSVFGCFYFLHLFHAFGSSLVLDLVDTVTFRIEKNKFKLRFSVFFSLCPFPQVQKGSLLATDAFGPPRGDITSLLPFSSLSQLDVLLFP